jgi:hypothetical protein
MAITRRNIRGNAATSTRLQNARTIGGVSFDGTGPINLPGVNQAGTQPTSGNAATASRTLLGADTASDATDFNTVTQAGHVSLLLRDTAPNAPPSASGLYYHVVNYEYGPKNGTGQITQIAISYATPANSMWIRGRFEGVWTPWRRFITNNGEGATGTWPISIGGTAAGVSTAGALNATAGANVGAVGTYALLIYYGGATLNPGDNFLNSSSSLRYSNAEKEVGPAVDLMTTWKAMSFLTSGANGGKVGIFLRVS